MFSFAWDIFRHYLLSRRAGALVRTVAWLCISGVALGVAALVVVTSVMNGFNEQIRKRLLAIEPHLVVKIPGAKNTDEILAHPLYQELRSRPGVRAEIFENQEVIVRTVDGLFQGALAKGMEADSLAQIIRESHDIARSGRIPDENAFETPELQAESLRLGSGEVLVGIDLARVLGIFEGDKIVLIAPEALLLPVGEAPPFERVSVKGFLRTNLEDIDANMIFFARGQSLGAFRRSPSREIGFEIRIPDPLKADELKKELVAKGLQAETWVDRNSALFYALKLEKIAMSVLLGLAALIASFSIITVLILLLMQKRKDIGLLMAIGLSPRATRALFVRVGIILSSIGILGGLFFGLVVCFVLATYPLSILPNIYYDTTIPASVDPRFIIGILVVAGVISYLSAYLPARTATAELPVEALRGTPHSLSESQSSFWKSRGKS